MKPGLQWLHNVFGRRASAVAAAYARRLTAADPEARLILGDLAIYCRVGQTSFVAGDPYQTAFNEGARDVFLHVADMAGLRAVDFATLLRETESPR